MTNIFSLVLFIFAFNVHAENKIVRDSNHFVVCVEVESKTYFFEWDPFIKTSKKLVRYFEKEDFNRAGSGFLKDCEDYKYVNNIPTEILHPVSDILTELSNEVQFSIEQITRGAQKFRHEKTAEEYISKRPQEFDLNQPEVLTSLKENYGDQFASEVMTKFIHKIIPQEKSCSDYIGSCDFYLCQEQKNPCGIDSYNLRYGYKYCSDSKFKLLPSMKTQDGKAWTQNVFTCLHRANYESSLQLKSNELTCSNLKETSYASHPVCYYEAGFCGLNFFEKTKIFKLIKSEILSSDTISQGLTLLNLCNGEKK